MKIRIKMYNEWIEYRSKKTAEKEMLDGVMKTEGAERARYTYAYFAIKLGIKEINTDADEQDY
jgi:hypothetical protein